MNEDNQTSTSTDIDAPAQSAENAPQSHSSAMPYSQQNTIRQSENKKAIQWIVAAVLAVVALPIIFMIGAYFIVLLQGNQNVNKAQDYADNLAKQLNSLVLVEGKSLNATGKVDADAMSASNFVEDEAYAQGSIATSGNLGSVEQSVGSNLAASGFVRQTAAGMPYYATPDLNDSFDKVMFRYVKGDKAIRVFYKLDKKYLCPGGYECRYTPETKPTDRVYPVKSMNSYNVKSIEVTLAAETNNQTTYW